LLRELTPDNHPCREKCHLSSFLVSGFSRSACRLIIDRAFDTLYHAVALENDATLFTADDAYFAKACRLGSIKLLTSFAAS
jgi:hypothetical protein